jgi:hypothetical protein
MKNKVHFFCIGAQKAGTTSLHDILVQHPQVVLPRYKESHFFNEDRLYEKGLGHYFSYHFPKIKKGHIIGEIDPEYLSCPLCPQRIRQAFGTELKFIILLRDPVDRAYSAYQMAKSRGYEKLSFEEAIKEEPKRLKTEFGLFNFAYIHRSLYTHQIEKYFALFPRENFLILRFDDFIYKQKESIEGIRKFLELSPFDYELNKASNAAHQAKNKFIRDFIYQPSKLKKLGHLILPTQALRAKFMHRLNKSNLKPIQNKEKLPQSLKKQLYSQFFEKEIQNLENLINQDLTNWKY